MSLVSTKVDTKGTDWSQWAVSFQWKNPDFLLKNPDFLLKNPGFLLKNVVLIIQQASVSLVAASWGIGVVCLIFGTALMGSG